MGAYIVHPKYENTRKPKILAHTRDNVVIHQNGVVWHQIHKINKGKNFAMQDNFASIAKILIAWQNFANLGKLHRDSEIENFRYVQ